MEIDRLTVREACELLGCSRAMVQKLEAAGELRGMRTNGRVVFERAAVEMLKADREIAKAQRKDEAVEKETRAVNAESDTRQVLFLAQDKAFEEQRERRQLRETMDAIRLELERLREDARCRAREAQLTELRGRARLRPTSPAAGLVDMLLELAPIALLAAAAYAVRDAKPIAAPAPEAGQPADACPTATDPFSPRRRSAS